MISIYNLFCLAAAGDYLQAAPSAGCHAAPIWMAAALALRSDLSYSISGRVRGHSRLRERAGKRKSRQVLTRPKGFLEMSGQWWLPRHFLWGGPVLASVAASGLAGWRSATKKGLGKAKSFFESMVGEKGFEPSTPCTPCKCATRLRYTPRNELYTGNLTHKDNSSRICISSWRMDAGSSARASSAAGASRGAC